MVIWSGPRGAGRLTAADISYPGNFLFQSEGKRWETALLESGTLRFAKSVLVDIFIVAGGAPGGKGWGDAHNTYGAANGGRGGNGGECKTIKGVRLRPGVDYTVTIGGSGEGTTISGDGQTYTAASGQGAEGGVGAQHTVKAATAGADGVYAYGEETDTTLISAFAGHKFGSGAGGAGTSVNVNGVTQNQAGALGGESNGPNHEYGKGASGGVSANGANGYANHGQGGGGALRYWTGASTNDGVPGLGGSGIVMIRAHLKDEPIPETWIETTASGNPICITDGGTDAPVVSLVVTLTPQQSGSGDPSLANARPIRGFDRVLLTRVEDGLTISDEFSETVYGGILDMLTGELTISWKCITLDGTESYAGSGAKVYTPVSDLAHATDYTDLVLCSNLPILSGNTELASTAPGISGYVDKNDRYPEKNWLYLSLGQGSNSENSVKAYFAEHPAQVVYRLKTDITMQLTAQQLTTLRGANTFTVEAGTMDITYHALSI